jgi:ribosomal protein S18 acetylase RimI-like enzyme
MNYTLRPATRSDCDIIADAIAQSSGGYAQLGWQENAAEYPDLDLLQIGALMYRQDKPPFTWRNCVVAQGVEPMAVMLAYGIDEDYQSAEPAAKAQGVAETGDVYYPVKMEVPDSWYICGMTVFERWRGQGIGSRLLQYAREQARAQGYPSLSLIAFEQNEGSVRLYRRNGFSVVERRHIIPHPMIEYRGDALLMTAPAG